MFLIGICDDEELHRQHIRELCEQYFVEYPQEHEYVEFSSGEAVLEYGDAAENSGSKLHLLFLDVEMGELDGIALCRKIENADWIWRIVFVSSHEEMVWNSFGIKTLEFGRKPVEYWQIEKWMNIASRENKENVMLEYTFGILKNYVALEDIYYLEAEGNYTLLHKKDEAILMNEKLKQWQKKTEMFPIVRIHKSYLINMLRVKRWEAGKVTLENGAELSIGRQYAKEAKKIYLSFVKKQAMNRM